MKPIAFDFETLLVEDTLHLIPEKKPREQKDPIEKASTDSNFIRPIVAGFHNGNQTVTFGLKSPYHKACQECSFCDERCILEKTWDVMKHHTEFIGFSSRGFDVPLLMKRSWLLNVRPTTSLDQTKYRIGNHYDLKEILANWEPYARGGLDFYIALKFGEQKDDITGADVAGIWNSGDYVKIHEKCAKDVIWSWKLFESMDGFYF